MTTMPQGYFNRDDPSKNYDEHLFLAGAGLQSAELNEIQRSLARRTRSIGDALFADGDIIRDASCVVNATTGETKLSSGAVYLGGAIRGVPPAEFTIPVIGIVAIGIYVTERVITALEDPSLLDPAQGTRNYQEPGAARLRVDTEWGFSGDGKEGEFYPVYEVEDGILRSKEPPPNLDAFTQSLARYDRDSAGGIYIVSGLQVQMLPDESGRQVYSVKEGRARVNGFSVELSASRRLSFDPQQDLRYIDSEPHVSTTAGSQVIPIDRPPIANVTGVRITAEKTATITHGAYAGVSDPLPDPSVLSILEVKQGLVTYVQGTDFKLTAGKVDWSLSGAEPATGSTYTVKYHYVTQVTPAATTATTITVTGAVVNSLVLVSYNQMLPRIDRIALNQDGGLTWVKGVAADWNPLPPTVPKDMLGIATIYQTWGANRRVVNDGVRVVPMNDLAAINGRLDFVLGLVSQQRLESSINLREAGMKRGVFVDPFLDDSQRDQGLEQTAAVVDGELTLPIDATVSFVDEDVEAPQTISFNNTVALQQLLRTGSMKINPYLSFAPVPAVAKLEPSVDRWTDVETTWSSPITRRFVTGSGDMSSESSSTSTEVLSTSTQNIETLRPIEVKFSLSGFDPNEPLVIVTFDGIPVVPSAL